MLIRNAKVVTCDCDFSIHDSIIIKGDRISAVGDAELLAKDFEGGPVIDASGHTLMPGMTDGHAHLDREGLKSIFPTLSGCKSIDDILQRIEVLVAQSEPGEWVVTMPIGEPPYYFDVPNNLVEKRWPTRIELDRISPKNPVYIRPIWGYWRHIQPLTSIANSLALKEAGLEKGSGDLPEIIKFETDNNGSLNGIIHEYTFVPIVELAYFRCMPRFGHSERVEGIKRSMSLYNASGTTSIYEEHGCAQELIEAYRAVNKEGAATVRASLVYSPSWHFANKDGYESAFAEWADWIGGLRGNGDDWLTVAGIFADFGVTPDNLIRNRAAPYTGWSGFNYDSGIPEQGIEDYLLAAARNDIRVNAIWVSFLKYYEAVDNITPLGEKRWVMGHLDRATDHQIKVMADLNLAMTSHTNRYIFKHGHILRDELGKERENEISPLRSIVDAGTPIALATDNVPTSLWYPVWQSISRYNMNINDQIAPEQALTREQALICATRNGAYLTGEEDTKGTLEPGKLADMFVTSADPLTCPENDIKNITAELTIIGGDVVHDTGNLIWSEL